VLLLFAMPLLAGSCGSASDARPADAGAPDVVVERAPGPLSVRGKVFAFAGNQKTDVTDAHVFVVEYPYLEDVVGRDGEFEIGGLYAGDEVTLAMEHPDFHPTQTETLTLGDEDIEHLTFQAPDPFVFNGLALILGFKPDESKCQMVTTVTNVGGTLYGGDERGEEGVVVKLDPALPAEQGPVYFDSNVIPDRSLTETSRDGGVLFTQVPPGEYTWTGSKPGKAFRQVRMKCRAGWLVNASPPFGLQAES